MSRTPALSELSGAILDGMTVDWRNRSARVSFLPSTSSAECFALRATGVVLVEVPRGQSASATVREVRCTRGASVRAEVEMDSGAVVKIEAAEIAVDLMGG